MAREAFLPEFWRLWRGEKISRHVLEWENPISMKNVERMIQDKEVIGQGTFDMHGHIDFVYWMPKKEINGER